MAVLLEGEWLQSPVPMGLKTDPDGITEAGTIVSPHIGSLKSRQEGYKGTKKPENYWKSALHNIAFLSSCRQPCPAWSFPAKQLLPRQVTIQKFSGLPSYYTHLAADILTSVFCPETGYFTVLSGTFLLQRVWILPWTTTVLCTQNSASVCPFSSSLAQFLFGNYLQLLGCYSLWECSLAWTPSLYLGLVLLYYFLFAKNVHFSLYPQQSEENRQLCP